MSLPPGSFVWLVGHDLRLSARRFRGLFGKLRPVTIALIVGTAMVLFHIIAWPVADWLGTAESGGKPGVLYYPALASAMIFIMPWLVSQALTGATRALYSRGDLDLLLASPLPARTLLSARALAIAIESVSSVAIFLLPVADMNVLAGRWHWLALYPALLACGLFATALGLFLTMALFALAGPRRTRLISQIAATIIGAAFMLALQALHFLPAAIRENLVARIAAPQPGSIFDRGGLLWLPVRAATGQWPDVWIWLAVSIIAFLVASALLAEGFALGAVRSAGVASVARPRRTTRRRHRFKAGVGAALRAKEWRLLVRDPWLVSQLFLQIVYTLPVSVVIWQSQGAGGSVALSVGPAIVVIASQIAASLAWLTLSSEDAPEFLASAPLTRAAVERRKLEAIAVPLVAFLALPLAGLAWFSPSAAAWTLVFGAGAAASTALLNLWHPMPGRRSDMLRRHAQSKLVGMMEHVISLCWAVAMVLGFLGSVLIVLPIGVSTLVLWINRPGRSARPAEVRHA
jgi:ABC-2 type transport system permease protein